MNDSGNNTIKWLFTVPGKKNLSIVVLIIVQALHGASGVLYALLLRNVVYAAVAGDHHVFWLQMLKQILFYNQIIYELCRYYEEYREDNNMT